MSAVKLSVIIVNYNVEYFLEQCLNSVEVAMKNVTGEVFVVDNNSVDGSVQMVREKFPNVHLIANKDNTGFSKANNQAMRIANGEYVLLLNPDTVVEEDTFQKVVEFMDDHPDAGGLGVKMIDGKGRFLPESKRGLPTPAVAFYKIFGLSKLFPKSKKFGRYHLGYLDKNETHEIEILSGAFMLMRKKALDEIGLLDEAFFMYGEDIDLSYRIIKAGYKNYYLPHTRIIHYKGESTKKSSINYVFVFYRAMVIFAEKHFSKKNASLFSFLINMAIYLRAGIAIAQRFIKKSILPLIDFSFITGGLWVLSLLYQEQKNIDFPEELLFWALPFYTFAWMISVYFSGGYDYPIKIGKIFRGSLIGTAIILMLYALFPKEWQFSRIFILLGTISTILCFLTLRGFMDIAFGKKFNLNASKNKKIAIVGKEEESKRVASIIEQTNMNTDYLGYVWPVKNDQKQPKYFLGNVTQLQEIINIHKIDEIIFCAKDLSAQKIIEWMSYLDAKNLDFKIAQPESLHIIGSNSIHTSGEFYTLNLNSISLPKNKRKKRTLDVSIAFILLLTFPLHFLFVKNSFQFFKNLLSILFGKKSFIGYDRQNESVTQQLPKIKKGVLTFGDLNQTNKLFSSSPEKFNIIYAKDYNVSVDLHLIWSQFNKLGKKV